jgi:hypothetical protein
MRYYKFTVIGLHAFEMNCQTHKWPRGSNVAIEM